MHKMKILSNRFLFLNFVVDTEAVQLRLLDDKAIRHKGSCSLVADALQLHAK